MSELTLYQTVHVAHGRARLIAEHVAILDAASREVFGQPYAPDMRQLGAQIAETALREGYPAGISTFVRIVLTADGQQLVPHGASLYDGYALRSLQPAAVSFHYELPFSTAPTSAREAIAELATQRAHNKGGQIALRCDATGIFRAADDAPLFGIFGRTVLTACDMDYAERELIGRAIRTAGFALLEEPFGRADLKRADELFYVDHRGLTALASCDRMPLMTLLGERIAAAMEPDFSKI